MCELAITWNNKNVHAYKLYLPPQIQYLFTVFTMLYDNMYFLFSIKKCLQGLNIAKMYYEAGEMEEALK